MVPKILITMIVACLVGLGALGTWHALSQEMAETLCATALTDADPEEQQRAALRLSVLGEDAVPQLRRLLSESSVPAVRAAAIDGLAAARDWNSMPGILAALHDSDAQVRKRANLAVNQFFGRDFGLRADMPPEQRATIIEFIRTIYQESLDRPEDAYTES